MFVYLSQRRSIVKDRKGIASVSLTSFSKQNFAVRVKRAGRRRRHLGTSESLQWLDAFQFVIEFDCFLFFSFYFMIRSIAFENDENNGCGIICFRQ